MQTMSTYLVVTQVGVSVYKIRSNIYIYVTVACLPVVKLTNGVKGILLDKYSSNKITTYRIPGEHEKTRCYCVLLYNDVNTLKV
jgi:hypothetical protein